MAVHRVWLPGPVSVTVLLGVAVPDTVGVVEAVPLLAGALIATVGVATAVKLVLTTGELPVRLPATAVSVCGPALNGVEFVQLQLPDKSAVAVHIVVFPSPTVTLAPGVAVPLMVGVVVVCVPFEGLTKPIVGAKHFDFRAAAAG